MIGYTADRQLTKQDIDNVEIRLTLNTDDIGKPFSSTELISFNQKGYITVDLSWFDYNKVQKGSSKIGFAINFADGSIIVGTWNS